jgi:hypothetical protein
MQIIHNEEHRAAPSERDDKVGDHEKQPQLILLSLGGPGDVGDGRGDRLSVEEASDEFAIGADDLRYVLADLLQQPTERPDKGKVGKV